MATYDYRDEDGVITFQKRRYEVTGGKKLFSVHRQDEKGGWLPGLDEAQKAHKVLYNLPDVITANLILLAEGEIDCDTLVGSTSSPTDRMSVSPPQATPKAPGNLGVPRNG